MSSVASEELLSLERLRREAFNCLETFPRKIVELNEIVNEFVPRSINSNGCNENSIRRIPRCKSTLSTSRDHDLTTIPEFDVTSYYSLSMRNHGRLCRGICKRRYYRMRGISRSTVRRKPGPLGQCLKFLFSRLTICAKTIVIKPSQFILDSILSVFFQGNEPKSTQCADLNYDLSYNSSLSTYVTSRKKDDTKIGNLIEILRPATVQLIAHTTILKRWLQALAVTTAKSPSTKLANATRSTETIDCWAYELFFHLKYLQVNRARRTTDKVIENESKSNDELTEINLWHRIVQLRDNYIILYENLKNCDEICDSNSSKQRVKQS